MEEINAWNYLQYAANTNATYLLGLAFLTWVGLRISSGVYADASASIIVRIAGSVFCLSVTWFWLTTMAMFEWNVNGVASVFTAMQAEGDISSGAQFIIANSNPGAEPSIMPNIVQGLFLLSALVIQLGGLWMKKD
ncbi:MAG: hypothetical protein P8I81_13620 [Pseudomonadales bacterium]|nr:hypothetical protein [Pseudomonadales bacterium]|tara:strand:- start:101 stop:508 length:408 start_codon:yes stop_codon:yes gene_type:complete